MFHEKEFHPPPLFLFSIVAVSAFILLTGCESPSSADPKTISATYESIETIVHTAITSVTPVLDTKDGPWTGTWAAEGLPDGLSLDSGTGVISGTPTAVSGKADYTVTLTGTETSAGVDGSATVSITVNPVALTSELPRSDQTHNGIRPDNYRVNFGAFSIKATTEAVAGNYRLAVRAASQDAPSATEIKASSATVVRKLTTTAINIFMSFHMDTTLFDAATNWDAAPNKGANNKNVKHSVIEPAMLQANTEYTLYLLAEDGTDDRVHALLSFSTDPVPTTLDSNAPYNLPVGYSYTIRRGEPFLIRVSVGNLSTGMTIDQYGFSMADVDNTTDENILPSGGLSGEIYFSSKVSSSPKSIVILMKSYASNDGNNTNQESIKFTWTLSLSKGVILTCNFLFQAP